MEILTNKLPVTVDIRGTEIPIDTDFRTAIKYGKLLRSNLTDAEKALQILLLFFPTEREFKYVKEMFEKIEWFYGGGKTLEEKRQEEKIKGMSNGKEGYSFELDSWLICAAFMSQYGIDLTDIDYMHWWKFLSLFNGLDSSNKIVEIMGYRTMRIDGKYSKEQKKMYQELQQKYALPSTKKKTREVRSLEQALVDGTFERGDIYH